MKLIGKFKLIFIIINIIFFFFLLFSHHLSIKKIRFSPRKFNANEFHLATCGNDNIVKILRLIFKKT